MRLYGYWRSSATWRVRIGLNLKGIDYTYVPVNLLESAQLAEPHLQRSPLGQVPVLELADGTQLTQSLAILQYADQAFDGPALLPADPLQAARALALAEVVNAGIQPLQNLAVLKQVAALGADRTVWGRNAIQRGLVAYQTLAQHSGLFSVGDSPTLADCCLVPQLYNARRFACDLEGLAKLTAIETRCAALPAFQRAHPDQQVDATSN